MTDRRRTRTVLAVLVLVSLLLLTLDYRQGDGGPVATLQRGALTVFAPLQDGFASVVQPIGGFFASIGQLGSLREENAALEADVQALRERQVSLADLERENAELRGLLGMRDRLGVTTTAARVIARPPGAFEWSVLIDVGAEHGVEPGMAVVSADGLVGKLTEVSRGHSRVQLLSSPSAGYAVRVADSGVEGLLRGQGSRPFQLEVLDPEAQIEAGQELVTRAFQGTTIPDGIPLGEVQDATDPAAQGTRFLSVRPYVDFSTLNLVQVVLDAPRQPADLPADQLVPDPDPPQPPTVPPAEGEQPTQPAAPTETSSVDGGADPAG